MQISIRNAARCERNGPSRRTSIPEVELGPRKAPTAYGISAHASTYGWSIRLRPIWSLLFGTPEASSSLAFSIALPASTKTVAVTRSGAAGGAPSL